MYLSPGTKLGPYEIVTSIGAGGMGEVYRAHDPRMGRDVAIKLNSESFSDRFSREVHAVAALNHSNICHLYDVGPDYLVMELCDGETLAARLKRGKLTMPEALHFAAQIADALSAAHAKGIVHRDLKPGNIMLTKSGLKVLDFGLAKIEQSHAEEHDMETITAKGTILGTMQYMSPEQAQGKKVDARSDIFSFGLVLYEMITGKRAFDGSNPASIIAAILEREAPTLEPEGLNRLVKACLAKDPDARFQSARDLKRAIDWSASSSGEMPLLEAAPRSPWLAWSLAAAALLGVLTITTTLYFKAPWRTLSQSAASSIADMQVTLLTSTGTASSPGISPDGKYVVYTQREGNASSLWMRQIETGSQMQLAPPQLGIVSFSSTISPSGGFVDFIRSAMTVVHSDLWRVPFLGGTPKKLLDSFVGASAWSPDGQHIAFIRSIDLNTATALIIADADGTHERQLATRKSPSQFVITGSSPAWSPDGRVLAVNGYDAPGGVPAQQVLAVDVASGKEKVLPLTLPLIGVAGLAWLDPETLVASISIEAGAPTQLWRLAYPGGQLSRLTNDLNNYGSVSLTADRRSLVTSRLESRVGIWIGDASGKNGSELLPLAAGPGREGGVSWAAERLIHTNYSNGHTSISAFTPSTMSDEFITRGLHPTATSDGRTIIFQSAENGDRAGLWKVDADGRHPVQLVSGHAVWQTLTPDNSRVIFISNRSGLQSMWSVSIDGGPPAQLAKVFAFRPSVSPDGKFVVFGASTITRGQLGICDLPACTTVRQFTTPQGGPISRFTPDGKGIAYYENGSGGNLWVQPLDGSASRQITHFADDRAIVDFAWSADGKRLAIARSTNTSDIVLFKGIQPVR